MKLQLAQEQFSQDKRRLYLNRNEINIPKDENDEIHFEASVACAVRTTHIPKDVRTAHATD